MVPSLIRHRAAARRSPAAQFAAGRRHDEPIVGDNQTDLVEAVRTGTVAAVFLAGSNNWHWSEDASPPLAFCLHALVHDGLQVPPFDRHHDGDGALRGLGLDSETWRTWMSAVVAAQGRLNAGIREPDWRADRAGLATLAEAASAPATLCPGLPELQARLGELWVDYGPAGERWKWDMTTGPRGVRNRLTPHEQRWLWKALVPFHDRLSTISVFLVDYPAPVVMALPPTTCLIAPASASADYVRQVLAAAEQLVAGRSGAV